MSVKVHRLDLVRDIKLVYVFSSVRIFQAATIAYLVEISLICFDSLDELFNFSM